MIQKSILDAEVASKPIVAGGELLDFKEENFSFNGERES